MPFGRRKASAPAGRIEVTRYGGRPVVDPSEETLREMVRDLAHDTEEHLVVGLLADRSGQTYVQVLHDAGGRWVVEHRAGSEETHAHAVVPDVDVAAAIVVAWAAGDPGWHDLADWRDGEL